MSISNYNFFDYKKTFKYYKTKLIIDFKKIIIKPKFKIFYIRK